MKYLTTATYTIYIPALMAHCEKRATFIRPYCLTFKGTERLIRKENPNRNLVRVEHATLSR